MKTYIKTLKKILIIIIVLIVLFVTIFLYLYIDAVNKFKNNIKCYKDEMELISQRLVDLQDEYNVDKVLLWIDNKSFFLYNKVSEKDVEIKKIPLNESEINALNSLYTQLTKDALVLISLENENVRFTLEGNNYGYVKVLKFKTANKIKKEIPVYDDLLPFYLGDGYYYFTSD